MNSTKFWKLSILLLAAPLFGGCDSNGGGATPVVPPSVLTVGVSGNGTVTSTPAGIANCASASGTCVATFDDETTVTLAAAAGAGSVFTTWAGDCTPVSGNPSQCTITLTDNETVLAVFDTPVAGGVGDTVVLTQSGKLLTFNLNAPGTILSEAVILLANGSPLPTGDSIVAIARRPANGVLYGLAKTGDSAIGRLYVLNEGTGGATEVAQISGNGFEMVGPEFGIQFDPGTVFNASKDRLRIADSSGKIYDASAGSGAVSAADAGLASTVTALAATNAFVGTGKRSLYAIGGSTLSTVTLPNTLVTVGTLGTSIPAANGFDIDAVNGGAYVAFTGASGPELRSVNLATAGALGASQAIGDAGVDSEVIRGLALPMPDEPQIFGICAGVNDENLHPDANPCTPGKTLIRFNASAPGTYSKLPDVNGLAGTPVNETVVALDVRPSTNVLYALTSDPGPGEEGTDFDVGDPAIGRIYTLNLVTSAATLVSTLNPVGLVHGRIYGFDFDPITENVRIVGGTADGTAASISNYVVTLATGAVQELAAPQQKPFSIASAAFTDNNAGATATTWYGVDSTNDRLFTIDRNTTPDEDPLTNPGRITFIGNLSFNASGISGFEILSAGQPPANDVAYVTRSDGANSYLNRVVLTNASSTAIGGAIGSLSGFAGQVVGLTANVNAGAATEMFVASTLAAPDARLLGFDGGDPSTGEDPIPELLSTNRLITGLTAGETVLALDFRFANNANTLFLLARGAGNVARLYTVNVGTGVATPVPPVGVPMGPAAGDITVGGVSYVLEGTNYAMDADPTKTDPLQAGTAIRIVSDAHENLAVNPTTGVGSVQVDLNQTPLPFINALSFTNNFAGTTSSELLLLDTNVSTDRVARLDASQILARSVASGVDNGSGDETSWDILGGHNGLSIVTEATCPDEDTFCVNTPGFSVLHFMNVSTDTATAYPANGDWPEGTVGRDTRTSDGEDSRILVGAWAARFPD